MTSVGFCFTLQRLDRDKLKGAMRDTFDSAAGGLNFYHFKDSSLLPKISVICHSFAAGTFTFLLFQRLGFADLHQIRL